MNRGLLYVLLFALPAFLLSGIAAMAVFGAAAGAMWLFAFGDNPWPQSAQSALGAGFAAVWLSLLLALLLLAFRTGKGREAAGTPVRRDVRIAATVTALAVAVIVLHQWRVGNLGPQSDGQRCSQFCQDKGFAGSSMPPRNSGLATCGCVDEQGREAITVPIGEMTAPGSR
jgi:hypothetical protein